MSAIARVGVDEAGGVILGPGASTVYVNGSPVSLVGDAVASHGLSPHDNAVIVSGSSTVYVEGIPVVRAGDSASCGHIVTGGSPNVNAN